MKRTDIAPEAFNGFQMKMRKIMDDYDEIVADQENFKKAQMNYYKTLGIGIGFMAAFLVVYSALIVKFWR